MLTMLVIYFNKIKDSEKGTGTGYAACMRCGMNFVEDMPAMYRIYDRYKDNHIEQRKAFFDQPDCKAWDKGWVEARSGVFKGFLLSYERAIESERKALEIGCAERAQKSSRNRLEMPGGR